jgi:hypothetical protein
VVADYGGAGLAADLKRARVAQTDTGRAKVAAKFSSTILAQPARRRAKSVAD